MKKRNLETGKLKLNKSVISKFESKKIYGGCQPKSQYCVTQEDWVCNFTKPPRCEGNTQQDHPGF